MKSDNSFRLDELIAGQWYEVDWYDEDADRFRWGKDLRLWFVHAGQPLKTGGTQLYSVMKTEDDPQVYCMFPENDFGQAFRFSPRKVYIGKYEGEDRYEWFEVYRPDPEAGSSREEFKVFLEAGGGRYIEGDED